MLLQDFSVASASEREAFKAVGERGRDAKVAHQALVASQASLAALREHQHGEHQHPLLL